MSFSNNSFSNFSNSSFSFSFSNSFSFSFAVSSFNLSNGGVSGGTFGGVGGFYGGLIGGNFGGGGVSGGTTGGAVFNSGQPADVDNCRITQGVQSCVPLVQPLGSDNTVGVLPGAGTFIAYFNGFSGWLFTIAVGFCLIWVVIGSFMIMMSGGPSGSMMGTGKEMIKWAIIGLVLLNFAGFILRTLDSAHFT